MTRNVNGYTSIEDNKQLNKTFIGSELGTRRMASLRSMMTKKELLIYYIGIFLITFVTSLESNFNYSLFNIALDKFKANYIISVFKVGNSLLEITLILLYSKSTGYIGRAKVYIFCLLWYLRATILLGVATSFSSFATAYFLTNNGSIDADISEAILLADLTLSANRAMFDSIDMIPYVFE